MPDCKNCNTGFEITDSDRAFYKKMDVPEPTLCPDCRMQRKFAWRNERNLHKTKCALTGEKILSMYPPDCECTVYSLKAWWGDNWDPMEHGREYDFTSPFFRQFHELYLNVPKANLSNVDNENCDYCNYVYHSKNCYLLVGSWFSEYCFYSHTVISSNLAIDGMVVDHCQSCYEIIDCGNCRKVFYSELCENCSDSWFLYNCRNCKNCIGCTNLVNKENYLFNKPVTKEVIEEQKKKISKTVLDEWKKHFEELKKTTIRKYMTEKNTENASGNYIYNSKNIKEGYVFYDVEDISYGYRVTKGQKDSMDITGCSGGELVYDSIHNDFCHRCAFVMNGEYNNDSLYCTNCYHCDHCFGCDGLRHKKYCILNRQYSKEEYEKLVPKIIEHMKNTGEYGEFFPVTFSPFAYNETIAQEFYPMTKEEVLKKGWKWTEKKEVISGVAKTIPARRLPDSIQDVPDDILSWAIECEETGRPFKIIRRELQFYRENNLPVPHLHPDRRHEKRMKLKNPMKLFARQCAKCSAEIQTTYAPDRPEKVYCEDCYLKEVY